MNELDEATLRANLRRRIGDAPDPATLERVSRSILLRLRQEHERRGRMRKIAARVPFRARLGLAAALVVAISLAAVPFAGGPRTSAPPSNGATALTPTDRASPGESLRPGSGVQVLSLAELQAVVARGDQAPFAGRVVLANVDVEPPHQPIPACIPGCPASVAGSSPMILVDKPAADADLLHWTVPDQGVAGPVIVRVTGINRLELVGAATVNPNGGVVWTVPSFVRAADEMPRTMDLRPNEFSVGPAFVVDGKLASGPTIFCALETQSTARIAEFACGVAGWLAPADVADPAAIMDGWTSRPSDWVRVQNGSYQRYAGAAIPPMSHSPQTVRGFYVALPLLRYDAAKCFQCDAGAVAVLYALLEPVAVP
jgi:hypothetical protein